MPDTTAGCIAVQMPTIPSIPRSIVVGIGAEKGVPAADFEAAVRAYASRLRFDTGNRQGCRHARSQGG